VIPILEHIMVQPKTEAHAGPVSLPLQDKQRIRAAAAAAPKRYPGPVGQLLQKELLAWEEFGYRLGGHSFIIHLVEHLTKPPSEAA
jgi:hypothetical protein